MPRKRKEQPENYNKAFPTAMRKLMTLTNTTQQELADHLGKTRQAVAYYCDGSSSPDWETIASIADYFNVSSDYLLGRTKDSSLNPSAVDELGLSEGAIERIRKLDKFIFDDLTSTFSNIITSPGFIPMISNIRAISETIKMIEHLYDEGKIIKLFNPTLSCELESTLSELLGFSARITSPQESIETNLINIRNYAENIAKEVSGYYDLIELLRQKLDMPNSLYTTHHTLSDIITSVCYNEYYNTDKEKTNAISQEENE